jgi:hypothetical protein
MKLKIKPGYKYLSVNVYVFFITSNCQNVLLTNIENSNKVPKVKILKRLCATRWVQHYDAITDFIELFAFVVEP